jgi:hypothetical protein
MIGQAEFLKDILALIVGLIIGWFGGYLTYRYKIKNENVTVKRDRLLKNITKIEDVINMMVEESFMEQDFSRLEELIQAFKEKMASSKKEEVWIREELTVISNERIHDKLDLQEKEELLSRLKVLGSRLEELSKEIGEFDIKIKEPKIELSRLVPLLEDHKKRLIKDDLGATGLTIDPSGKLADYILELQKIISDPNKKFYSDARAIELRSKINHLFDDLITKTG